MSRKPYSWLVVVRMISLCIGLSGCGKNVDTVAESTVPIEIGEHVMYGSYQGEPVEWRVLEKKMEKFYYSVNMDWIYCLLMIVEAAALSGKIHRFEIG